MTLWSVKLLTSSRALCNVLDAAPARAFLAQAIQPGKDSAPPAWVEIVPAGPEVKAVDGRKFRNTKPEKVVERFNADANDLPIDYEHSSEIKGPKGEEAPAAGWITELEVRDGAIWAHVEWTPRGNASLTAREYRYLSPAFMHGKDGEIIELTSAGLTNRPALRMTELARETEPTMAHTQEKQMTPEMLKLLGLAADATPEQALAAVQKLQAEAKEIVMLRAAAAQGPALDKFVPRAEYEAALARAQASEKTIKDTEAKAHASAVEVEIDAASKAGKVAPTSVEYFRKQCASPEGLAMFRDFVKGAPVVVPASGLDDKPAPTPDNKTITDEQLAIFARCGITKEAALKSLGK